MEKKEKVTRLPQKTLVYSVFLTHSWTGEEGEEWACQQVNKHSPVCVFSSVNILSILSVTHSNCFAVVFQSIQNTQEDNY